MAELAVLAAAKNLTHIVKTSLAGKPHGQDLTYFGSSFASCDEFNVQPKTVKLNVYRLINLNLIELYEFLIVLKTSSQITSQC